MPWTNADGLLVYFAGEPRTFQGGEYPGAGANRTIEVEFDLAGRTGTAAVLGAPWVIIPRNSVIESVEVISETPAVGGTNVDVGLQRFNGTEYDYDGLVTDILLANINVAGEKTVITAGATFAGALVGTETIYPSYLTTNVAGTFSAGRLVVRVNIYVKDEDTLVNNW